MCATRTMTRFASDSWRHALRMKLASLGLVALHALVFRGPVYKKLGDMDKFGKATGVAKLADLKGRPIAIAAGCRKCPAFGICPLKGVIGDYRKEDDAPASGAPKKPAKSPARPE